MSRAILEVVHAAADLSAACADSRAEVVEAGRQRERRAVETARVHHITAARTRQLRHIAMMLPSHAARLTAAMRDDWLTALDAAVHLDVSQMHARLSAMRADGVEIHSEWVRTGTANGGERVVRAYRLGEAAGK